MDTTFSLAYYLNIRSPDSTTIYRFQNFYIGEDATFGSNTFGFLPFGFSGTTVTKGADNEPAALVFPNNSLTRSWIETAVAEYWVCHVRTLLVNADDKSDTRLLSRIFRRSLERLGIRVRCSWS